MLSRFGLLRLLLENLDGPLDIRFPHLQSDAIELCFAKLIESKIALKKRPDSFRFQSCLGEMCLDCTRKNRNLHERLGYLLHKISGIGLLRRHMRNQYLVTVDTPLDTRFVLASAFRTRRHSVTPSSGIHTSGISTFC